MNRRDFLICAATMAAMPMAAIPRRAHAASRPNFVVILSDDQAFDAWGAAGGEVHTPHLDRLAQDGVTFTHAYNQGGWHGAVCVASRTMLMTGRTLWNAKAIEPTLADEVQAGRLWPQYLAAAGYDTYSSGKWHVQADAAQVFGTTAHIRPGMPSQTPAGYHRPMDPADYDAGWKPWETERGGFWEGGTHWSEVLADDATAFLDQAAAREAPFFMYLAFNAPHDPRQAPREFVDQYPVDQVRVPDNFLPEYPDKAAIGCGEDLRDEQLAPFPRTEYAVRVHRQEYHAIISHMDAQVGRILEALDATGKAEHTVVLFTSDHGLAVGQHGLMGKQNMYDHSVRVPLIVCGPGFAAGTRITAPVYLQDIMPTTLELAGIPIPPQVQFQSLLPLLEDPATAPHAAIYGAYIEHQRMIVQGGFKLIRYPAIDKTLLFDLEADPWERHNLAGEASHADTRRKLEGVLRELQRELNDPLVSRREAG